MDEVITLSSDSDNDDSDVEIVGSYNEIKIKTDPPPLTAVRVDVGYTGIKLPAHYIELTDPRWTLPELKLRKRQYPAAVAVVDLTESDSKDGTQVVIDDVLPCVKETQNENSTSTTSIELDVNLLERSSEDSTVSQPVQEVSSNLTAKHGRLDSTTSIELDVNLQERSSEDSTVSQPVQEVSSNLTAKHGRLDSTTSIELDVNLQERSSEDSTVSQPVQEVSSNLTAKHGRLDCEPQHQKEDSKTHQLQTSTPNVKLVRIPFLETHVTELKKSTYSVYVTKDCTQMSLCHRQMDNNTLPPECIHDFKTTTSNGPDIQPSVDESAPEVVEPLIEVRLQENSNELISTQLHNQISYSLQSSADFPCKDKESSVTTLKEQNTRDDERGDLCPSTLIPSPTPCASSQDEAQGSLQSELHCADVCPPAVESRTDQLELDRAESRQGHISDHSSSHSLPIELDPSQPFELENPPHTSPIFHNLKSPADPIPSSEDTQAENTSERQFGEGNADEVSSSFDLRCSISSDPPPSVSKTEDVDEGSGTGTYRGDLGIDSPVSLLWQDGSDGEVNEESRYDMDFRGASREDRHYVCPITLRKMAGATQSLTDNEDEEFESPEVLCRQSLSLVYITIDENYPESTLQLLSDLLEPGYYPPKDIISHLLHGILLDPQCPRHLCQHAFNLLMRTQRHHMADKNTVPWDWELLTTVMANQENTTRLRWEVVRMLLEYIVQTLEDDFQAKRSMSSLHHSIAKATLSCDQQFPRVREVIKWLFSAIVKSTEHGESREAAKDKDEQIRMVSILQRMLSLALEVDRSPALNSVKLSQELFHMFISNTPLRAHRMLLLESLQSKLLRCKLLEHLLDYACPLKISVPMSLSLLLHFLKNCTLTPDPTDGTEKWQKWEELIHLLWMLLLSYNKAMKGYLCSSATEQRGSAGTLVYKPDDIVTKPAIREAVESFLSRSQADIGQALPLHMEESLTYLQDYLLDVSQC